MLVRIVVASVILILGSTLLALRSLGVQDFKKITNRITRISIASDWIRRRAFRKLFTPLVISGVVVGALWPTVWITFSAVTKIELPGVRYYFLYLRRLIEVWPPSNAGEWAIVLFSSESILAYAVLLLMGFLYLAIRFAESGYSGKKRKAVALTVLIILSPVLLPLTLYVSIRFAVGILLVILLAAAGVACCLPFLFVVLAPMKLTSLAAERLAKHNVERLAAIAGILLLLISALLFADVF